jgi:hypothetical protein
MKFDACIIGSWRDITFLKVKITSASPKSFLSKHVDMVDLISSIAIVLVPKISMPSAYKHNNTHSLPHINSSVKWYGVALQFLLCFSPPYKIEYYGFDWLVILA